MHAKDITTNEYASFYANYIASVGTSLPLLDALEANRKEVIAFYKGISEEKMLYAYAPGKWTIKEVLQHVIDSERIFAYRALRFARNDQTELPGYEQDDYVTPSRANEKSTAFLLEDFDLVRKNTISLFKSFSDEDLLKIGRASENNMSVRAVGFICVGHINHHTKVVKERYL